MKDQNFFRVMGLLQLLIGFINFYIATTAASQGSVLAVLMAVICTMAGVISTVSAAKLMAIID